MKIRESAPVVSPPAKPWDIDCSGDVILTKQEFAADADINQIIARCVKSNMPLPAAVAEPLYADVSEIGSYADCVRRVAAAEDAFMQLPAAIRTRFDNDAGNLVAFLADPSNLSEAQKIGLIDPPKEVVPVPAVPTP